MRLQPIRLWSSTVTFVAAMIAMYISMRLALPRPWWVLMSVYVTTQPLAGTMRPKMIYRLAGIVLGAAAAVFLVAHFAYHRMALTLGLAIWVAGCLYFAILARTPIAFGFMLAAYTAVIVGFPYLDQPEDIFQIAVDRVLEMCLGVVCPIVAHLILLPWSPAAALRRRVDAFLADGRVWFAAAFSGVHGFQEEAERQRFAADIAELSILAVHLPADAAGATPSRRMVGALQDELATLLPLASATQDRLDALRRQGPLAPPLAELIADVTAWLRSPRRAAAEAPALKARCAALAPDLTDQAAWPALLQASLCQRLREFIDAYVNSLELARHLARPQGAPPERLRRLLSRQRRRPLHQHHPMAMLSALGAAGALIGYCTIWILSGWPEGAATAAFSAIISCSFSSQDDPAPAIMKYLGFTVAALPLSAVYLFGILPAVDGVAQLAVALAPALLFMGYLQADPARAPYALPMLACFIVAMGFLDRFTVDYARFYNVAFAQMGGVIVTIAAARLFRSVGAEWSVRRILRRSWRDVAALATSGRAGDEVAWSRRMHDRVGLVASRIALMPDSEADALRDLRVGRNVIRIRRAQQIATQPAREPLDALLSQTRAFYADRAARGHAERPPASLLAAIDAALAALPGLPPGETRRHGLLALTGLRRNLFPGARAYQDTPA